MFTFKKHYFFYTVVLFVIEVLIAMFLHDRVVRPYVGDFLVVILIYCFVRTFFKISVLTAAIGTLIFAYVIEFLQYLRLVELLGLQNSKMANLVLGNLFEWIDMLAYTFGILVVLLIEKIKSRGLNERRMILEK